MIKLNIGAGFDIKPTDKGWVNIDGNANNGINHVMDLTNDAFPYPDNSVDHILAQNIIEHISRHKQEEFVTKLYKMLKVGGTITIEMPNLKAIAEMYLGLREDKEKMATFDAAAFLFGAQEDEFGCHRWIYDGEALIGLLIGIGFRHYYIDEVRGTNLIYKAIKSDARSLRQTLLDCALSSEYCIVEMGEDKNKAIAVAIKLVECGRIFCYGDFPQFEHENLIKVPEYRSVPPKMIEHASVYIGHLSLYADSDDPEPRNCSININGMSSVDEIIDYATIH